MKFKKTHTIDDMIHTANDEADGYFQVHYPGTDDVLGVQVKRDTRNHPHVTWLRKPAGTKQYVEVTRSAAAGVLDTWRAR